MAMKFMVVYGPSLYSKVPGGLLGLIFGGYVPLASQNPCP